VHATLPYLPIERTYCANSETESIPVAAMVVFPSVCSELWLVEIG
jgi:hypothetical protein